MQGLCLYKMLVQGAILCIFAQRQNASLMLSITYFYREPRKTGVSIEGIFRLVKECLKDEADIKEFYCDARLSRLQNTIQAGRYSNQINHITGDVNFLALGLRGGKNILTIHDLGHYDT